MKAVRLTKYGGKEAVSVVNISSPEISSGKILIQVYAAGVNPIEWKIQNGFLKDFMPLDLPVTLGGDFSGVITQIGDGESAYKVGDEVYGQASVLGGGSGSFAEVALASQNSVAKKPKNLNFLQAGALPLAGVSALQALTQHSNLSKGQKILIHGGAGGIGSVAIQIAKHLGAFVATTVSSDDIEYVKSLGADEVINHQTQRFEDVISGYDSVFDTVGGDVTNRSVAVLKKDGILVSMVQMADEEFVRAQGIKSLAQMSHVTTAHLSKLAELVENGDVTVHLDKVFPIDQAAEALFFLQHTPPKGKIVLEIKK